MRSIKDYKLFEGDLKDQAGLEKMSKYEILSKAKSEVSEALLPLKDSGLNVIVYDDNFDDTSVEDFNCFSIIVNNPETNGTVENLKTFNFGDIIDDIWQAISIPSDYDFQTYVMTLLSDKMYFIWSPTEAINLSEKLEEVGKVTQITISFVRNGDFVDKMSSNIERFKDVGLPGLDYNYDGK